MEILNFKRKVMMKMELNFGFNAIKEEQMLLEKEKKEEE
jgi:hypothetical protein